MTMQTLQRRINHLALAPLLAAGLSGCGMRMTELDVQGDLHARSSAMAGYATTIGHGSQPGTIFAPSSFWYQPIPAKVVLHPDSTAFVEEFVRQKKAYYGTVGLNTDKYASPVYLANPDTPVTAVGFYDCQKKGYAPSALMAQWQSVPIPSYAEPAGGTDAEMSVYQPSSDTLWEFWVTKKADDGTWQACWGGQMTDVSHNPGIWPSGFGTTATGLPFVGGQITAQELARGQIDHVIGIALVDTDAFTVLSWPANRSDGFNPKHLLHRIAEGQRFRLDPALDVDALGLHPVARTIARAAQKYGFVVWDKAGAITLRLENPKSYTLLGQPNPYPALFNGTPAHEILKKIPWDRLQFLPMDFGKPGGGQ